MFIAGAVLRHSFAIRTLRVAVDAWRANTTHTHTAQAGKGSGAVPVRRTHTAQAGTGSASMHSFFRSRLRKELQTTLATTKASVLGTGSGAVARCSVETLDSSSTICFGLRGDTDVPLLNYILNTSPTDILVGTAVVFALRHSVAGGSSTSIFNLRPDDGTAPRARADAPRPPSCSPTQQTPRNTVFLGKKSNQRRLAPKKKQPTAIKRTPAQGHRTPTSFWSAKLPAAWY